MSGAEIIATVAAVIAAGTAAAVGVGAKQHASKEPATAPAAPATPPAADGKDGKEAKEAKEGPDSDAARATYLSSLFGAWTGLITTAGTIAAGVGTWQLAKDIGKGETTSTDHLHVIIAAAAFALGIALLITVPVTLRARSFQTLDDVVRAQRRWNRLARIGIPWTRFKLPKHHVVPSYALLGYDDAVAFSDGLNQLTTDMWTVAQQGGRPPDQMYGQLKLLQRQQSKIQASVATTKVRSGSGRAVILAGFGMTLAVAGFADATYITNRAVRAGAAADATIAQQRKTDDAEQAQRFKLDEKILDAALTKPQAADVLPSTPSAIRRSAATFRGS